NQVRPTCKTLCANHASRFCKTVAAIAHPKSIEAPMNPANELPTSLILVEGNRLLREGLAAMVSHHEDLQIVATLADCDTVLQKIQQLKPRVVLLDLGPRDHDHVPLIESITRDHGDVTVIVMDLLPGKADVMELVRAGVSGFLLKDATFDEFLKTIRLVA